jgi:hypothetical protein
MGSGVGVEIVWSINREVNEVVLTQRQPNKAQSTTRRSGLWLSFSARPAMSRSRQESICRESNTGRVITLATPGWVYKLEGHDVRVVPGGSGELREI